MIFADPPYFLSNGGLSWQKGKITCVDKGDWDRASSKEYVDVFNHKWLALCREKLSDSGTIWVTGTYHNIFNIADNLSKLDFKILNVITWVKTNPPPNVTCRLFTYSTEFIIWARKSGKVPHTYNYELMKRINAQHQMTDVWKLSAVENWEKSCGSHPTQKPLNLLARIILASTYENDWILDPFSGSSTTGIAANLCGRRYLGIEKETEFVDLAKKRRIEIDDPDRRSFLFSRINDLKIAYDRGLVGENYSYYGLDLPF